MELLKKVKSFSPAFLRNRDTDPAKAYNLWAQQYDSQPGNLMLDLDEQVVAGLLENTTFAQKNIADVGCGTGRHWQKFKQMQPAQLIGFDVSHGMLDRLAEKYPQAQTHLLTDNKLPGMANGSCDVVISTLTIAHIKNAEEALTEWARVLKKGGHMFITDYHPTALQNGGNRTFKHNNKVVAVKNYVHTISYIQGIAAKLHLIQVQLVERKIDETMKHYYDQQNALAVFDKFNGSPIIYGIHLRKG